jgi:hypothetical protein
MGVRIVLNRKVEDLGAEMRNGGFDAAFDAIFGECLAQFLDGNARMCPEKGATAAN